MEKILLWAAVLVLFGVSVGYAKYVKDKPLPLDMAPNSVDDNYSGCQDKMRDKVKKKYLDKELNNNKKFRTAWTKAGKFYKTWVKKNKGPQYRHLQREHVMAVYVYSLGYPNVYGDFNVAVRTQRAEYSSLNFGYHALHFYLTEAIQTLNSQTSKNKRCVTSYRRVDLDFCQYEFNKEFRFGAFTSSSEGDYPDIKFGKKSCFNITSCFGADITHLSSLGNHEREVLIPPYEVFKVIKTEKSSAQKELPCQMVYTVQSTRSLSNLKCALVSK